MRKLIFVIIFILKCLNVFSQDAFIDQLTGTVEVRQPGENSFKAASKGDVIFQDTVISTGFKSYAIVKTGTTIITVRPLTALSLTEIQNSDETEILNVHLQTGRVRVEVKPPAGTKASATLTGPSTIASVRGTCFEFGVNNVSVKEGAVSFAGNKGQNVLVSAGENSRVEDAGQVTTPRDERNSNLLPPSPVGTSDSDTLFPFAAIGAKFTLTLEFR